MNVPERADIVQEPISMVRCRELLGDEANELSDNDVRDVVRHAEATARPDRRGAAGRSHALMAMARRRTLLAGGDGTKLTEKIGAVMYVRVSTKERTENIGSRGRNTITSRCVRS